MHAKERISFQVMKTLKEKLCGVKVNIILKYPIKNTENSSISKIKFIFEDEELILKKPNHKMIDVNVLPFREFLITTYKRNKNGVGDVKKFSFTLMKTLLITFLSSLT